MRHKTCKSCGNKFQPTRSIQPCCGYECSVAYGIKVAEKNAARKRQDEARAHREAKAKAKTLTEWLNDAQVLVNRYIRKRDEKQPCISCGTTNQNIQYAAGHYRSRGAATHLRFNHDNIHKQCNKRCNLELSGNHQNYRAGLIEKIGLDRVLAIENDNTQHKWTIDEVKEIIETHKRLIKELDVLER